MTETGEETQGSRPSRKGLYIPILLFCLACLGWTGFWFYARSRAIEVMDVWLEREARLGRDWNCPARAVDGFPFRMRFTCTAPTFASREPGRAGQGTLAGLEVTARVVDPRMLIAQFSGPLVWTSAAGDSVKIDFSSARASFRGTPRAIDQASVELSDAALTWRLPHLPDQTLKARAAQLHLRRAPGAEPATEIALSAEAVDSPLLNLVLGDPATGTVSLRATVDRMAPTPVRDWRQALESWHADGGSIRIDGVKLAKGPYSIDAKGTLGLDPFRRPSGAIDGQATGLMQLLGHFGQNLQGSGGFLGALLGGIRQQPTESKPRPLPIVIRFDNGRVWFGPIQGPRLRPLF